MNKYIFCFLFFYSFFGAGAEKKAPPAGDVSSSTEESQGPSLTPSDYCQRFALQYAKDLSHSYRPGSLSLKKENYPPEENILAQYTCQFQTVTQKGVLEDIFVTLFLVADQELAVMIRERRWSIIPISHIKESAEELSATEKGPLAEGYGIFMSHEKSPPLPPSKEPEDMRKDRTSEEYCQSFAEAWARKESVVLDKSSLTLEPETMMDKVEKWASNFFQPHGAKFVIGYRCRFETEKESLKERKAVSVYLFLVETYNFARHTSHEAWQILPIEYLHDPESKKAGYGVFKFLEHTNP